MTLWSPNRAHSRRVARTPPAKTDPSIYSSFAAFLAQIAIDQLFGEFDALELEQTRVFLSMAIKDHVDLPGTAESFRVLDRGLVIHRVRIEKRIAFDHVQAIAREIAG